MMDRSVNMPATRSKDMKRELGVRSVVIGWATGSIGNACRGRRYTAFPEPWHRHVRTRVLLASA